VIIKECQGDSSKILDKMFLAVKGCIKANDILKSSFDVTDIPPSEPKEFDDASTQVNFTEIKSSQIQKK
jgi:hypothetical protein